MKWINVKDQLPKEEYVLAYGIKNGMPGSYIARYLETPMNDFLFNAYWIIRENTDLHLQDVTHWMPLPEMPDIQYKRLKEMEVAKDWGATIKCETCNRPPCNYCN